MLNNAAVFADFNDITFETLAEHNVSGGRGWGRWREGREN